jgi:hypothetical protein
MFACLLWMSCIHVSTIVQREDVERLEGSPAEFHGEPYKVHLVDGSMVLFADGFEVKDRALVGKGMKYNLPRTDSSAVWMVPRDSIALVLRYREESQALQSVAMSLSVVIAFSALLGVLLSLGLSGIHG